MQAFWYNVTKADSHKYGPSVIGSMVKSKGTGHGTP